ncbi:hypothetical protein Btru_075813 [Bulinus truncatus]|nr:hypothetical protein Btru_075813 [Bulinus truncatus]
MSAALLPCQCDGGVQQPCCVMVSNKTWCVMVSKQDKLCLFLIYKFPRSIDRKEVELASYWSHYRVAV